jgi:hypothetical protein
MLDCSAAGGVVAADAVEAAAAGGARSSSTGQSVLSELPAILFLHLRELAVKFCNSSRKRGPGRATTDLKPRSTACCPTADRPAQFDYQIRLSEGSRSPGLRPKQPNPRSAPARAASAGRWSRLAPKTTCLLGTPCLRLHNATPITKHSKKKEQKGRYSE